MPYWVCWSVSLLYNLCFVHPRFFYFLVTKSFFKTYSKVVLVLIMKRHFKILRFYYLFTEVFFLKYWHGSILTHKTSTIYFIGITYTFAEQYLIAKLIKINKQTKSNRMSIHLFVDLYQNFLLTTRLIWLSLIENFIGGQSFLKVFVTTQLT